MSGNQGQKAQQQRQRQQQRRQHVRGKDVDVDALLPDEKVVVDERPALTNWIGLLVLAGLLLVGALVTQEPVAMVAALVVDLFLLAYVWYQRRRVRYLVTDRRILVVTGISAQATNEAWLEDVRGMQTGASFLERLLGHGTITVSESILPRKASLPGAGLLTGLLPIALPGAGLTLGGISEYDKIANLIRKRQAQRKG